VSRALSLYSSGSVPAGSSRAQRQKKTPNLENKLGVTVFEVLIVSVDRGYEEGVGPCPVPPSRLTRFQGCCHLSEDPPVPVPCLLLLSASIVPSLVSIVSSSSNVNELSAKFISSFFSTSLSFAISDSKILSQ